MGATHMHPGAITPMGAILNTTTASSWAMGARKERERLSCEAISR
ncbi:unnamed protein product [Pylaiella littoralis]